MSAGTRLSCPQKPVSKAVVWIVAGIVVAAWGVNFVFAKEALNQFDVGPFNFIRFASMAVLGWAVLGLTGGVTPVRRAHRGRLVAVAVVGFCGYVFGFSVGLSLTSAFSASLLLALVPLFVMLFTSLERRNLPAPLSLIAVAAAAAGCVLFVTARTSVSIGWGDLVTLLVAASYAIYLMAIRPLVVHFKPFTLTTYATTIAAVPIVALTVPTLGSQDWSGVDATGWAAMSWVVIGPVFVAWSVWNWVLRHLDAERVAPLLFTVPITSGVAASFLLDEQITGGQVAGTTLVVAGLLLNRRATRVQDRLKRRAVSPYDPEQRPAAGLRRGRTAGG